MKPFLFASFLLFGFGLKAQSSIDSIYAEADSLYAEELIDAKKYILEDGGMYICPYPTEILGGIDSLYNFAQARFKSSVYTDTVEGIVYLAFTMDTTGFISNIDVMKGVNPKVDSACVTILESMPRWLFDDDLKDNKIPWGYFIRLRFGAKQND